MALSEKTGTLRIPPGLSLKTVEEISQIKKEPQWMRERRKEAYEIFCKKAIPKWGPDLSTLDFSSLTYFLRRSEGARNSWDDVPEDIKKTYDALGIPEAEKKYLSGVSAQYESEAIYESVQKTLVSQGVIFCDMDSAVRKHGSIIKKYFGKLIPSGDNKFAALNTAVWSGGSFLFVPKNTTVSLPLQAYFRINEERFGQFERTLIVAESGSSVHYVEGCTAPAYDTASLHAAVVEIFASRGAQVRYTTVQNWSTNIFNLVTKRAKALEDASVEWVDCNIGSATTMKYPCVILSGKGARGSVLSLSIAGKNQNQDTGAKMIHLAPNTKSHIVAKSIATVGGKTTYRGLISVAPKARNSQSFVRCDSLIADDLSIAETDPTMRIMESSASVHHEATTSRISADAIAYLRTRGIPERDAEGVIATGFADPIAKELPMEYAVELNRLIAHEMNR